MTGPPTHHRYLAFAIAVCALVMAAVTVHVSRETIATGTNARLRGRCCLSAAAAQAEHERLFARLAAIAPEHDSREAAELRERGTALLRRIDDLGERAPSTGGVGQAIAALRSAARSEQRSVEGALSSGAHDAPLELGPARAAHDATQSAFQRVARALTADLERHDGLSSIGSAPGVELLLTLDFAVLCLAVAVARSGATRPT